MIFPLIVLIIVGMISLSVGKYGAVAESSERHKEAAATWADGRSLHAEDALRARWYLEKNQEE